MTYLDPWSNPQTMTTLVLITGTPDTSKQPGGKDIRAGQKAYPSLMGERCLMASGDARQGVDSIAPACEEPFPDGPVGDW